MKKVNSEEMEGWKRYRFSDFVTINPLVSLQKDKSYSFIEMKDLNENYRYVYPSTRKPLNGGARFLNGDTLFARITPCLENGKICQAIGLDNTEGFGSTEFLVFRGKPGISDSNFVYYLCRTDYVRRFAELHMVGTSGRQRVSKNAFENLIIDLPPLPFQQRIAEILSALDDKIELNRQMNHTLEQMAQALYKHYFVDDIDPENLPEGWRIGKLESLFKLQRGFDLPSQNRVPGKYQIISASGLNGFHDTNMVKGPGVTTGRSGVIGNVFYILEDFWPLNTSLFVKEFFISTPLHAFYVLKSIDLAGFNSGSAVPTLNRNEVHSLDAVIPPIETIFNFESIAKPLFDKIRSNELESESLMKIRDASLTKLISGELIPSELQTIEQTL